MRTLVLLGGAVVGVVIALYHVVKQHQSYAHEGRNSGPVDEDGDGDFVFIPRAQRRRPVKPKPGDLCPICQELLINSDGPVKYGIIALPCGHWFDRDCAVRLLEYSAATCPICRSPFHADQFRSCLSIYRDSGDF